MHDNTILTALTAAAAAAWDHGVSDLPLLRDVRAIHHYLHHVHHDSYRNTDPGSYLTSQ